MCAARFVSLVCPLFQARAGGLFGQSRFVEQLIYFEKKLGHLGFGNAPDDFVFDFVVSVDQHVAEIDDVAMMWDALRGLGSFLWS